MRTLWTAMFHFIFIANLLIFKSSLSSPVQQPQVPVSANCQDEVHWLQTQLLHMQESLLSHQQYIQQLHDQLSQSSTGHQHLPDAPHEPSVQPQPGSPTEYTDCSQVFKDGNLVSGVYMIKPKGNPISVMVFCDMSDGGGWTVFQKRKDGQESFNRTWVEYKHGFGNLISDDGEFWLGNDPLHYLTSQGNYRLKIKMEDFDGIPRFAEYKNVKVGDEKDEYELQVGDYKGNAGDALVDAHPHSERPQGLKFSTYDHNNRAEDPQCIHQDKSGWWFSRCHSGNLNGHYYNGPYQAVTDDGVVWYTWHGFWYSIKSVVMMIRPEGFEEPKAEHEVN